MVASTVIKSAAGRPQENALTGPGYALAEYLNEVWERKVSATNQELAQEWKYRSPGIISMWRTGKSRVPIERLPDLARLVGVDLAVLLPLWLEQYSADHGRGTVTQEITKVFKRLASVNEFALLKVMRNAASSRGEKNPVYTPRQLQAVEQILASDEFADRVLADAKKDGLIKKIEAVEED